MRALPDKDDIQMTTNGYQEPGHGVSNMQKRAQYAGTQDLNALHEIIKEHLKASADLSNLLTSSNFPTERIALAVSSLVERGMKRYSDRDRKRIEKGEISYMEAAYPIRLAAIITLTYKSIGGFASNNIVRAVVGSFGPSDGRENPEVNVYTSKES